MLSGYVWRSGTPKDSPGDSGIIRDLSPTLKSITVIYHRRRREITQVSAAATALAHDFSFARFVSNNLTGRFPYLKIVNCRGRLCPRQFINEIPPGDILRDARLPQGDVDDA
jgi:hypothetical protein